jgi:hypothetical protein
MTPPIEFKVSSVQKLLETFLHYRAFKEFEGISLSRIPSDLVKLTRYMRSHRQRFESISYTLLDNGSKLLMDTDYASASMLQTYGPNLYVIHGVIILA